MLIFVIIVNLLAVGILMSIYTIKYGYDENLDNIGFALTLYGGLALLIAILVMLASGVESRENADNLYKEYLNLQYKIEHKENYKEASLVEHINNFNVNLRSFKAKQSSPFLNWFYPGDLTEVEYLKLED